MNRLEIRTEVRRIIAQTLSTSSYVSDDDINVFIVEGEREMCEKVGVYLTSLQLTVTNNTSTYLLPWNLINVKNILRNDGSPIGLVSVDTVGTFYTIAGKPTGYFVENYPISVGTWAYGTYTTWTGTVSSTYITPTTLTGYMFECTFAGVTGFTEPAWPSLSTGQTFPILLGKEVTDGTITWKTREVVRSLKRLNLSTTPTTVGGGTGTYTIWYTSLGDGLPDDTSALVIPGDKQHYLVSYVAYRCAVKMKQTALATAFYNEFAQGLGIAAPAIGVQGAGQ